MSWTDEEIDNLFKDAAAHKTFEFKPEYWKDIESQLPIAKVVKPKFWWWVSNVFLIGFMGWVAMQATINPATLNKNTEPTHSDLDNAVLNLSEKNDVKIHDLQGAQKNTKATKSIQTTTGIAAADNNKLNSKASNKINKNKQNKSIESDKISIVDPVFKTQLNKSNEGEKVQVALLEDNTVNGTISNAVDELVINSNDKINLVLAEIAEYQETENTSLAIRKLETNSISANLINGDLHPVAREKRTVYAELDGGIGQSWTQSDVVNSSVNGLLGFHVGIVLPVSKFNLSIGAGMSTTKFDELKIKERTKLYSFGSNELENTYDFKALYAVSVPVSLAYSFKRHSLNIGVTTTLNLFSTVNRTEKIDGNEIGYTSGVSDASLFSRFGLQPSLGYSFAVNEKVQIGVQFGMQLLQPIQSDRFINTPIGMPFNGQFSIRRTFKL